MNPKHIVIIGGGVAGLRAVKKLTKYRRHVRVTLIDRKGHFDFLPALPDGISGKINRIFLANDLEHFCQKHQVDFILGEVTSVNFGQKQVLIGAQIVPYDFLLIASGSETNFYGNIQIQQYSLKLDTVNDIPKIQAALHDDSVAAVVIGGAGYTGIEIATHIWRYCHRNKIEKKIIIVERAPSILGPLPEWMKAYTINNLQKLGVEVLTQTTVENVSDKVLTLSTGAQVAPAALIWAAGVKTSPFIDGLALVKDRQGRIVVDPQLQVNEHCFVIGDAAHFDYNQQPLRMGVQFSLMQAECAVDNIVSRIRGKPLRPYRPYDLGYIVPMANNKACGIVLGMSVKGIIPIMLHYFFCIFRSIGWYNRWGILKSLVGS